jgi:hypothetical protein
VTDDLDRDGLDQRADGGLRRGVGGGPTARLGADGGARADDDDAAATTRDHAGQEAAKRAVRRVEVLLDHRAVHGVVGLVQGFSAPPSAGDQRCAVDGAEVALDALDRGSPRARVEAVERDGQIRGAVTGGGVVEPRLRERKIEACDAVATSDEEVDERAAESAAGAGDDEVSHAPNLPDPKNHHTRVASVR